MIRMSLPLGTVRGSSEKRIKTLTNYDKNTSIGRMILHGSGRASHRDRCHPLLFLVHSLQAVGDNQMTHRSLRTEKVSTFKMTDQ